MAHNPVFSTLKGWIDFFRYLEIHPYRLLLRQRHLKCKIFGNLIEPTSEIEEKMKLPDEKWLARNYNIVGVDSDEQQLAADLNTHIVEN